MKSVFQEAIDSISVARADGELTAKDVSWIVSLWVATVGETVADLTDPGASVDREWAEAIIKESWAALEVFIRQLKMPKHVEMMLPVIFSVAPMLIKPIVDWLIARFDSGEEPEQEGGE